MYSDDELKVMSIQERNDALDQLAQWEWEMNTPDPDEAHERWLENGGAAAEIIAWENEQDRLMSPFDPIWG